MARYDREYGREFGGRGRAGMRPDGWGAEQFWRGFPMDESWPGGPEAFPAEYQDRPSRNDQGYGGFGGYPGGYSAYGDYGRPGYGSDFGGRGGSRAMGYGGRDSGYLEGWQDQRGGLNPGIRHDAGSWSRPRAAEIMTENPHVVTPDASIEEVARKMRDLDVGIIPVVDNMETRRLRGVITDRDIAVRAVAEGLGGTASVSDCMTDRVRAVNKNDSIQDVMWVMRREQVRRVPVTDREGRLVGIIAQADLAVDYASDDSMRETEVGETIERISEPARPERSRAAAGAREGRNGEPGSPDRPGRGVT